ARSRCRLNPRFWVRAVHRRYLVLHRLYGDQEVCRAVPQIGSEIRLAFQPAETSDRHGGKGRDVLWPFPAEEAGSGVNASQAGQMSTRYSLEQKVERCSGKHMHVRQPV